MFGNGSSGKLGSDSSGKFGRQSQGWQVEAEILSCPADRLDKFHGILVEDFYIVILLKSLMGMVCVTLFIACLAFSSSTRDIRRIS